MERWYVDTMTETKSYETIAANVAAVREHMRQAALAAGRNPEDITLVAAILYRYAAYQGYDVSQRADLSGFGDASSIRPYAQEALSWASAQGLVLGFEDGSLRPQGTASRAQIAAVLMRFLAAVPTA